MCKKAAAVSGAVIALLSVLLTTGCRSPQPLRAQERNYPDLKLSEVYEFHYFLRERLPWQVDCTLSGFPASESRYGGAQVACNPTTFHPCWHVTHTAEVAGTNSALLEVIFSLRLAQPGTIPSERRPFGWKQYDVEAGGANTTSAKELIQHLLGQGKTREGKPYAVREWPQQKP